MTDLSFHVRQFVPAAPGEELEHRTALLKARDYAAALRGSVETDRALAYAAEAHDLAGEYVYADVPAARLKIAVAACRNLVHAAFLLDHLDGEAGQ